MSTAPLGAAEASRPIPKRMRRAINFAVIGVISTVGFAVIYGVLRTVGSPVEANVAALSITMVFNFIANRALTFRESRGSLVRQGFGYVAVYLLGVVGASALLTLGIALLNHPSAPVETMVAVLSGGVATVIRFVLLSAWVFRIEPSVTREGL